MGHEQKTSNSKSRDLGTIWRQKPGVFSSAVLQELQRVSCKYEENEALS